MNILIIEDNQLKREKVREFVKTSFDANLFEACSYNSGVKTAIANDFDFIILDMSMPTFDRTDATNGGRFRAIGGKEIASKLFKIKRLVPFAVLTGYKDFSVDARNLSIEEIDELLKSVGDNYRGCVLYDVAESGWKEKLFEIIRRVS